MAKDFQPTQKQLKDLKAGLEKQHGREFNDDEVRQAVRSLQFFAEITLDLLMEENERKKLLIENPAGLHLEGSHTCCLCRENASNENSWYDKHGIKCMPCQIAINKKIIPSSVIEKRDTWYSINELESYFNIKGADLRRYIKKSILKKRDVVDANNKVCFQLFLIKDNKDVLPPKSLLKSRTVIVVRDEKEYYAKEEWYEFADEKLIMRLAKYRIIECLRETLQKPMKPISSLIPKSGLNPLFTSGDLVKN